MHSTTLTSSFEGGILLALDSIQNVVISPLPFTLIVPRSFVTYVEGKSSFVALKKEESQYDHLRTKEYVFVFG